MIIEPTIINLLPEFFGDREHILVEHGSLKAATFRYQNGVCALRLENGSGNLVMLPYQGQQFWSAEFYGRCLTMKSMFAEPRQTREYLANYGGFFLHCGVTAMGGPSKEDTHPLPRRAAQRPLSKSLPGSRAG